MKLVAEVTRYGALDMQVCVPIGWPDDHVLEFAEHANPCGTEHGWSIRKQHDEALDGDDERVPCDRKVGFVHIVLDA